MIHNCAVCDKEFEDSWSGRKYCSLSCSNRSRLGKNEVKYNLSPIPCKGCVGFVPYAARFHNVFCSSSCAAKFNNELRNRNRARKEYRCKSCGGLGSSYRYDFRCRECFRLESLREFGERTLGEFKSTYARHKYQKIRSHAHRVADQFGLTKKCFCGYDKYVELAHKMSIGSFSKDTKLKEINSTDNLVYLCPNHHWEFDSGILELGDVGVIVA